MITGSMSVEARWIREFCCCRRLPERNVPPLEVPMRKDWSVPLEYTLKDAREVLRLVFRVTFTSVPSDHSLVEVKLDIEWSIKWR